MVCPVIRSLLLMTQFTVTGLDAGQYTITVINNESSLYYESNAYSNIQC